MIIGVTGPSGAGKSVLCSMLAERGFRIFDCDGIYHDIISGPGDCTAELARRFGTGIIDNETGGIDRSALADTVFGNDRALADLNSITHKYVLQAVRGLVGQAEEEGVFCVIDAPLLFESKCDLICDITVGVLASRRNRMLRLIERDGKRRTPTQILARIDAAKPEQFYRGQCTYIFRNKGSLEDMATFADKIAAIAASAQED